MKIFSIKPTEEAVRKFWLTPFNRSFMAVNGVIKPVRRNSGGFPDFSCKGLLRGLLLHLDGW